MCMLWVIAFKKFAVFHLHIDVNAIQAVERTSRGKHNECRTELFRMKMYALHSRAHKIQ